MERDLHSKSKELQSLIQEKKLNRNRILEICEDIISLDAGYAVHKRVDETLWNACFYSRFEELKVDFKKSKNEIVLLQLQGELDRANSFYKMLILEATFDKDLRHVASDPGLIIAYKSLIYLGDIDQSIEKQLLRHYQVLALSLILSITKECAAFVNSHLESGETIDDVASSIIEYLLPISVLVTWLSNNTSTINTFISYGAMLKPKEFENKLHDWANALVPIVNKVSSFADMDGGSELIFADSLLVSLSAFKEYYVKNSKVLSSQVDSIITIFSRMAGFVKSLSEDEDGLYVVRDNSAKRKELQKMMKALATEKLKEEVKTLERQQGNFSDLNLPVFVLDVNCFLTIMNTIKSWLMSKSCIIIVPYDVIQSLDSLKNGEEKINYRARDAIRYLEQRLRYPSIHLIGQKPEEEYSINELMSETIFIPQTYQSILQCCQYFKSKSDERADGDFALVTANPELTMIARDLQFPVIAMDTWKPKRRML
ncbi:hypothetical protein HDV06_000568 [Boothiomyces sp. JEL0866]|nr:hypothetical protein HDV06_000568 [Boothiomyces sp. JEL0866]